MLLDKWHRFRFFAWLIDRVPIITWLPKYSIHKYIANDLIAGITVGSMQIPQGLAYGMLAGVTPNTGLYMAFFPAMVYVVFGTSRHVSIGTLSIVSLMTFQIVGKYSVPADSDDKKIQIATATAFACGIQQVRKFMILK